MAASSRAMISDEERRFPVRIRIDIPAGGFGQRLDAMYTWLDANCGADGWTMMPAGLRSVVNDAIAIYFRDATLAAAFVARWCRRHLHAIAEGAFVVRDDDPVVPHRALPHKTP